MKSFSSVIRLELLGYLVHLHLGHQRHKPREEGEGEGEPIMIGQSTIKMEIDMEMARTEETTSYRVPGGSTHNNQFE